MKLLTSEEILAAQKRMNEISEARMIGATTPVDELEYDELACSLAANSRRQEFLDKGFRLIEGGKQEEAA